MPPMPEAGASPAPQPGPSALDAAIGVDLHGAQVGEAIDEPGLLSELLREGVGQVVRRVGRR